MQEITNKIYYVGVNDRNKNLFEGLWPLPNGVSYNSYLIDDEKVCLIDSHVLGDTQGERGLTHGRTSRNDDKVGSLPPRSHLIHTRISRRNTRKTALVAGSTLKDIDRLMHNRSHLRIVLFHIALRDGKQVTLCLLHQLIDIYALVESLRLDVASIMDELASQILLRPAISSAARGSMGTPSMSAERVTMCASVAVS